MSMRQKYNCGRCTAVALALATAFGVMAADDIKNDEFNPITTGVTSLGIAPDARGEIGRAHV